MNTPINEYTEYSVTVDALTAVNADFEWVRIRISAGNEEFARRIAASYNENGQDKWKNARVESRHVVKTVSPWTSV